jgi:hypothetical protein
MIYTCAHLQITHAVPFRHPCRLSQLSKCEPLRFIKLRGTDRDQAETRQAEASRPGLPC